MNGFDNFESLSYLNGDTLAKIGITEQGVQRTILESLRSIAETYQNADSIKHALNTFEKKIPGTKITPQFLIKHSTNSKSKDHTLSPAAFLGKITHLSLNDKKIAKIESLDLCPRLKVLLLYDNKISRIEGLDSLKQLTHLALYNNLICKIEGLDSLENLTKLYLEKNCITRLEGLTGCVRLEELVLAN